MFVCEGTDDETFLNTVLERYPVNFCYKVYKYNTNIHIFSKYLFSNYLDTEHNFTIENLDIIQVLKEYNYQAVLENKFTDILFVFDFDPQDPRFNISNLNNLLTIFSDSTSQGQLFINYPMVESAFDFIALPDINYKYKTCDRVELNRSQYKNRIKKTSIIKTFDQINDYELKIIC